MMRTIASLVADGEIVAIQDGNHGGSHPKTSEYAPDGIPFVMAADVCDGRVDLVGCKKLPKERADRLRIGFARAGDVLLTHKGTVGQVAIVPPVSNYIMLTPQVTYYRINPEKVDPRYLSAAFRAPDFQQQLQNISAQSTRPYVAISTQRQLKLAWVPLPDQRRIGAIIGAYDDLIEVNHRRIALLEQMARGLFEEWFIRFRFPGHEADPYDDGALPKGWEYRPLGDLVHEMRDAAMPTEVSEETRYVGLEHLPRRSTTLADFGTANEVTSLKLRFQRGDILFGKIRPYFHKVVWAPFAGIASSDAIILRPVDPALAALALSVTSSDAFVAHSVQTSNGTKMPRANWGVLKRYPVPLPSTDILERFNSIIVPAIELAAALRAANEKAADARDLLLPRLVSGQLTLGSAEEHAADASFSSELVAAE